MLHDIGVNSINTAMKTGVETWYKRYMTNYTAKLEDSIFCSDRSITKLGGWNPDGGNLVSSLQFKNNESNGDLSCTNITDKFSISNNLAKLTYPVGLLTSPEAYLLNNNNILKTEQDYWLISPNYFISDLAVGKFIGQQAIMITRVSIGLLASVL